MAGDGATYGGDNIIQSSAAPIHSGATERLQSDAHPAPPVRPGLCPNQIDPNSPEAKAWADASRKTENDSLQLNADGTYTVNSHDCLSTVAVRLLHMEGKAVNSTSIDHEVEHLRHLNNKNYNLEDHCVNLQEGWHLRVHGGGQKHTSQPVEAAPAPAPAPNPGQDATTAQPTYGGRPAYAGAGQEVAQPGYAQPVAQPGPSPLAEGLFGFLGAIAGAALAPRYPGWGYWHGRHYERGWYPGAAGFGLGIDPNMYDPNAMGIADPSLVQYPYYQATTPVYYGGGWRPEYRRRR